MKELISRLHGDKVIWAFVALLALFSFMPVFSASSNLAYIGKGTGNTLGYLVKHLLHIAIGFYIIYKIHKIPYHYFKGIAWVLMPVIWILLAYTLFFGVEKGNASRWLQIPFVGISFQTSTLAFVVLMIFVARYLSKTDVDKQEFKTSFLQLWLPVGITILLILPSNFSTAAFMFAMIVMLVVVGQYSMKYTTIVIGIGLLCFALFVGVSKVVNKAYPNNHIKLFQRVSTWEARAERFFNKEENQDPDDIYQIERAKTAIATGGISGLGPGKSVQKNFLPQSSSDFIFAIIVEEYGLVGAFSIIGLYLLLLFRFMVAAHKSNSIFGKLLVIGLGFPIIFQAMINMGVAVELLPVTGQTLPLISSGGSSIWMTCIALGIILSVTKKEEEIAAELKLAEAEKLEREKREEALQRIIDRELDNDTETFDENQDKINQMKKSIRKKIEEEDDELNNITIKS